MTTPTTAAGRKHRDRLRVIHSLSSSDIDKDIFAIEAEAAAPYREALERLADAAILRDRDGVEWIRRSDVEQALRREVGE